MIRARTTAGYALAVLTFINLFNYLDRWVVAAVVESIKRSELHLTDTELGLVGTGFIFVYTLTSPIFGSLGDRKSRPPLIAIGVALWSIATALAGFARGFASLFAARSAVGIGEAAYGTIAPALLADSFPLEKRGRVFSTFFAAIPIGSAAGYVLGGLVDKHFGWRAAFWIAGAPGVILAVLVLFVFDPPRGSQDHEIVAARGGYLHLLKNTHYMLTVVGYGAYTFALGGLAFWMPAFLERSRGMTRSEATVTFGAIALGTGFVGTFGGGWLGDFFLRWTKQSYLWVSGIVTLIAAPATYVALTDHRRAVFLTAIVIAELMIFASTGPVNSAIVNAVAPAERATAVGLSVFVMHLIGDIPSPPLIGKISDATSLEQAFLIVPVAVLIGGAIWTFAAWRAK
ncbi:MAG TPA: MFS transporter [Thermoanaerobaculia bacterium]|nr:MFS transporter [Thermoanaerobaculia bacterium]